MIHQSNTFYYIHMTALFSCDLVLTISKLAMEFIYSAVMALEKNYNSVSVKCLEISKDQEFIGFLFV